MTKQKFKELMTELLEIKQAENNLNKAFKAFEPDFNYICFGRYETLVVNSIKEAMNDRYDWIGYWLYECDCGKEYKTYKVTTKDGKHIPLKTLDDLYKLLTENSELK